MIIDHWAKKTLLCAMHMDGTKLLSLVACFSIVCVRCVPKLVEVLETWETHVVAFIDGLPMQVWNWYCYTATVSFDFWM